MSEHFHTGTARAARIRACVGCGWGQVCGKVYVYDDTRTTNIQSPGSGNYNRGDMVPLMDQRHPLAGVGFSLELRGNKNPEKRRLAPPRFV